MSKKAPKPKTGDEPMTPATAERFVGLPPTPSTPEAPKAPVYADYYGTAQHNGRSTKPSRGDQERHPPDSDSSQSTAALSARMLRSMPELQRVNAATPESAASPYQGLGSPAQAVGERHNAPEAEKSRKRKDTTVRRIREYFRNNWF